MRRSGVTQAVAVAGIIPFVLIAADVRPALAATSSHQLEITLEGELPDYQIIVLGQDVYLPPSTRATLTIEERFDVTDPPIAVGTRLARCPSGYYPIIGADVLGGPVATRTAFTATISGFTSHPQTGEERWFERELIELDVGREVLSLGSGTNLISICTTAEFPPPSEDPDPSPSPSPSPSDDPSPSPSSSPSDDPSPSSSPSPSDDPSPSPSPSPSDDPPVVDDDAPETDLVSWPPEKVNPARAEFTFTSTEDGTFECSLDGGGFLPCMSPQVYEDLRNGRHVFHVRAKDVAGNVDQSPAIFVWTVAAKAGQ